MSAYTDSILEQIRDNIDTEVCEERGTRELRFWRHVADGAWGEKVDEIDLIDYTEEVDSAEDLMQRLRRERVEHFRRLHRRDASQVVHQVDTSIHNARNLDHRFYNIEADLIDSRFDGLSGQELDREILLARRERLESIGRVYGVIPDTEAEKERRERELTPPLDDEHLAHRLASVDKSVHNPSSSSPPRGRRRRAEPLAHRLVSVNKKDHSKTVKENRNNTVIYTCSGVFFTIIMSVFIYAMIDTPDMYYSVMDSVN